MCVQNVDYEGNTLPTMTFLPNYRTTIQESVLHPIVIRILEEKEGYKKVPTDAERRLTNSSLSLIVIIQRVPGSPYTLILDCVFALWS